MHAFRTKEELLEENTALKQRIQALEQLQVERKWMEEVLLEDILFTTDDSGFITFISPSAVQIFGWKPEEMVSRSFIEFLPESEIPGAVAEFKDTLASGQKTRNFSCVMKRKDENTFTGEVNSSVILTDGHTVGKVGVIRDITERKRMEEALRESEDRYRKQIEAINDVAYCINNGGEFTYISPVVKNLLGYEPDEMTGRHILDFVHPEDHDLLKRNLSELREGIVSPDHYRMIGKYRDIKWVRTLTSPITNVGGFAGGRGVIVDITYQKQTEAALRRSEENFHRSLDESPLGVRIVTIEGETLYANRAILDIYGYDSLEELKATPVIKRYTPESYAEFLIRKEKRRQHMDVPSEYTVDILTKSGEVRHLQVFRKEILWDGERQFQTIYNDITERKQAEEALVAKSQQLVETNSALRVLLKSMKEDQHEIEKKIIVNIQKLVLPNLETLSSLRLNNLQARCLETAVANLQQVTSPFLQNLAACFSYFTPREIQVADMIRQGKTSKEIANIFNTSIRNVEFHRGNIRKKLGLSHKKSNLHTFLIKLSNE